MIRICFRFGDTRLFARLVCWLRDPEQWDLVLLESVCLQLCKLGIARRIQ